MDQPRNAFPDSFSRAQGWAHAQPWLRRFTLMTRLLLAMAFIPTGLVKATGQRFTVLGLDSPVGFFFEAMYRTGPYWNFIGVMQIVAGVCLLIPATATLGALLFLPIAVSIFFITWGVGFTGTVYITGLLVLAVTYLVCWDADRIWTAGTHVLGRNGPRLLDGMGKVEIAGWVLGGLAGLGVFLGKRGFMAGAALLPLLAAGFVAILLVVAGWILESRRRPGRS